eukprot:scaffold15278_cov37-Attheya_sp.AAC.7
MLPITRHAVSLGFASTGASPSSLAPSTSSQSSAHQITAIHHELIRVQQQQLLRLSASGHALSLVLQPASDDHPNAQPDPQHDFNRLASLANVLLDASLSKLSLLVRSALMATSR